MFGRKMVAAVVVALAVVTGSGLLTSDADAANGFEQWTSGWSDGCLYYWNGFDYTEAACPRVDNGFNFFLPVSGVWTYSHSAGVAANGNFWLVFQDGSWLIANPAGTVINSSFLQPSAFIGSSINWEDPRIQEMMKDPAKAAALMQLQETLSESIDIAISGF